MAQPSIKVIGGWPSWLYAWPSQLYGGVVAHKILVSAPVPFGFRFYWDLFGVGRRVFGTKGFGPGLDNNSFRRDQKYRASICKGPESTDNSHSSFEGDYRSIYFVFFKLTHCQD